MQGSFVFLHKLKLPLKAARQSGTDMLMSISKEGFKQIKLPRKKVRQFLVYMLRASTRRLRANMFSLGRRLVFLV